MLAKGEFATRTFALDGEKNSIDCINWPVATEAINGSCTKSSLHWPELVGADRFQALLDGCLDRLLEHLLFGFVVQVATITGVERHPEFGTSDVQLVPVTAFFNRSFDPVHGVFRILHPFARIAGLFHFHGKLPFVPGQHPAWYWHPFVVL